MSPHLSVMEEGDLRIPKIQVIKFTGRPTPESDIVSGGFLDFDCNLGIDPERLAAIAETAARRGGPAGTCRVSPRCRSSAAPCG